MTGENTESDGSARVELQWGGATRAFRLGLGEIRLLQKRTGYGIERLFVRVTGGDWLVDEVAETLLLGLEGAGEKPEDAADLVERYFHNRPKGESLKVAALVLRAVMQVVDHDPLGKPLAAKTDPGTPT